MLYYNQYVVLLQGTYFKLNSKYSLTMYDLLVKITLMIRQYRQSKSIKVKYYEQD